MVSENKPKIMFRGQPITEKLSFKKLKILLFLAPFISKTKIVGIFNFQSLRYFGYCLSFWIFYIHWSTFVEIRDCWTGYFGSLDTADNNLITDKGKSSKLANKFFLKDIINSSVCWKLQVFWPTDRKMTALWDFSKTERKRHFIGSFCQVCGISK